MMFLSNSSLTQSSREHQKNASVITFKVTPSHFFSQPTNLTQDTRIAGHSACGTILECQDSLGLQNLRIANSLSCHSEVIAEESKGAISNEMFRSTQHDKVSDSGTDSQISESTPLLQDSKASAAIHKAKEQSSITNLALVSKIITNTTI